MPEITYVDPTTYSSGASAAAQEALAAARRMAVYTEIEDVNRKLYDQGFKRAEDLKPSWADKTVDPKAAVEVGVAPPTTTGGPRLRRGQLTTGAGRTVDDALAELEKLDTYTETFAEKVPAAIRPTYQSAQAGYGPGGEKLPAGAGDPTTLVEGLATDPDKPLDFAEIQAKLRMVGTGDYGAQLEEILAMQTEQGQNAFRIDVGTNPRVAAWYRNQQMANVPVEHGPVGAVDMAAARRLAQNYQAARRPGTVNYQQATDRLFTMTQAELNTMADQLFAAGYLQPKGSNWDWTRSFSSQSLVTADTLNQPVTNWFAETARARKGTSLSEKLDSRIKANQGEMDRMKKEATDLRNESLRYLTLTADEVARQTLGRSLGGAWNAKVVGGLADRAARGFDVSQTAAAGEVQLAIDADEELRGQREAYQTMRNTNAIYRAMTEG